MKIETLLVVLTLTSLCTVAVKCVDTADSDSSKSVGKCRDQLDSLNSQNRPKIGAFTPRCNENGDFVSKQCHGSTGQCWCVEEKTGQEWPDTRTEPGQTPIDCDARPKNCRAERDRLLAENVPPGTFIPTCSTDGQRYSPLQCRGTTDECWCVDPLTGRELIGTKTSGSAEQEPPLCPASQIKICPVGEPLKGANDEEILCSFTTDDVTCPENYTCVPRDPAITSAVCCQNIENPTIEPRIIVNAEKFAKKSPKSTSGEESENPLADIVFESNDSSINSTNKDIIQDGLCTRRLQSILSDHRSMIGVFVPRCDYDGSYAALQCHGSIGNCWCVQADGTEIPATRVGPGQARPNCKKARLQENSEIEHASFAIIQEPRTIKTAKNSPTVPPFLNTDGPCHKTVRSLSLNVESTVFVPRCTPTGFYQPLQCHGPDLCWCSTPDGLEIPGSRTLPGCGLPDCDNLQKNETEDEPGHLKPAASEPAESQENLADFLPMCTLPKQTGLCHARMIRYYFSPEHRTCLAFSYGGCGGNDNNFLNKTSCLHTCLPADYGSCYGNQKAYHGPLSTSTPPKSPDEQNNNHGCTSDDQCPAGYKCKFAGLINFCCNKTIEDEWSESYNFQCSNNLEPYKDDEDSVLLSDRCGNDFCPLNYVCQENKHFAYCCRQSSGNQSAASDEQLPQPMAELNTLCQLPKDPGYVQPGSASIPLEPVKRWFYNLNTKSCESFLFHSSSPGGGGNANNFENLEECLETCGQNQTIASSIEPAPTQITGKGEEQEEIVDVKGQSICDQPKNQGSFCRHRSKASKTASSVASTEIRWYFNKEKFTCMAFKYNGCSGNGNNFLTKGQCEMRCKPQDGPNCNGKINSYQSPNGTSLQAKNCQQLKCPNGWTCRMGWIFATCCNKTVEDIFDDAYNETCKNGAKAFTIARPLWSEPYFGDTCQDLICPSGYECVQSTPMFAKCCSTTTGKVQISASVDEPSDTNMVQESIGSEDKFKCPVGSPVLDEVNFEYRSCDSNNTCPQYAYCWTGSTNPDLSDDGTHEAGFCCMAPKIPSLLQTTLSKQNCSSATEKQLLQCAMPIANLTKRFQISDVAMKPSVLVTSNEFRIKTLNESCSIYKDYLACTSNVFKSDTSGYCYNYIDNIIHAILGFVCQPKIRAMLDQYHTCLEGVIDHPVIKECVADFNETIQRDGVNLGAIGEDPKNLSPSLANSQPSSLSFSGICFAIENFVNCSRPIVVANCSADLFQTIAQFVQKASIAIFGGTCEQVAASDAAMTIATPAAKTGPETTDQLGDASSRDSNEIDQSKCTSTQTDKLHACWRQFTNVSTVAYFASPHADPEALMRKEDVTKLDELCNSFQAFNNCLTTAIAINPACSPSVYSGLSRVIAATCEPNALKNWKNFGFCYAELSSREDVQKCLSILRQAQHMYSVDRGINLPFDQLCAGADQYIECSRSPIAEKCGKEAADFYAESYERNKRLIFPPCLTLGSGNVGGAEDSAEGSRGSGSSATTISGNLQSINDRRYHY